VEVSEASARWILLGSLGGLSSAVRFKSSYSNKHVGIVTVGRPAAKSKASDGKTTTEK
jgi:hypothetical protein